MAIVKVIELISEGESIDAAIRSAVQEAAKTVKNIKQINVNHIEALVDNDQVSKFRINSNLSFVVEN